MNKYSYLSQNEIESILKSSPNDKFAWKEMGMIFFSQNKFNKAISNFELALKIDPEYIDARANIGIVKIMQNKYDEAIEQFNIIININPNYIGLHYSRAEIKYTMSDMKGAIEDCEREIQNDEKSIQSYRLLGFAHLSLGNYIEALKNFLVLLRYYRNSNPKDCLFVGECYYHLKDFENAKLYFQKAFDLIPPDEKSGLRNYLGALVYESKLGSTFGKVTFEQLTNNISSYMDQQTFNRIQVQSKILDKPTVNLKPYYPLNSSNVQALLDTVFPSATRSDVEELVVKIKNAQLELDELEKCSLKLVTISTSYWFIDFMSKSKPTQSNLLQYAIEAFIDVAWDLSEKNEERMNIITKIKSEYGIIDNDVLGMFTSTYGEVEKSWHDSPFYDDNLDDNEQSADFWDDVL